MVGHDKKFEIAIMKLAAAIPKKQRALDEAAVWLHRNYGFSRSELLMILDAAKILHHDRMRVFHGRT